MKTQKLYTLFFCFFCLFFSVQAQEITIQEIRNRIQNTNSAEAQKIQYLAFEAPNSIFMNETDGPSKFLRPNGEVESLSALNTNDVAQLVNAFPNDLSKIAMINVDWNSSQTPVVTSGELQKLNDLQYIFIKSKLKINPSYIQSSFSSLINLLKAEKPNVIILYQTLGEPN